MIPERFSDMLSAADGNSPFFPPTLLFNENWLLRVILDWFSRAGLTHHKLLFGQNARWFSEALLPSAFLPRHRGDPLAESWTHADGVIGHFKIGGSGKGDLCLLPSPKQFVVLEGKIFSRLSPGVKNAPYFDQAARNVACMAEVLRRADCPSGRLATLGFYVLAPASQLMAAITAVVPSLRPVAE